MHLLFVDVAEILACGALETIPEVKIIWIAIFAIRAGAVAAAAGGGIIPNILAFSIAGVGMVATCEDAGDVSRYC